MPHTHHCKVCQIAVAHCSDDACQSKRHPNAGEHYCSQHHPNPDHRIEMTPPPPRYAVLVKDQK